MNYPEPKFNPDCQCKGNLMRQMFCKFGHRTECHYPYTCASAACSHLHKYDFDANEIAQLEARAKAELAAGKMPPYVLGPEGNIGIEIGPTPSQPVPTLSFVVHKLLELGADRGALFRSGLLTLKPAIMVFMLGNKAVREVGPYLRDFVTKLKQTPNEHIHADHDASISLIMAAMADRQVEWMWVGVPLVTPPGADKQIGLACCIVSDSINQQFANELTKRGCVTNFT